MLQNQETASRYSTKAEEKRKLALQRMSEKGQAALQQDDEFKNLKEQLLEKDNIIAQKQEEFEKVLGYKIPSGVLDLNSITDENTVEQLKNTKVGTEIVDSEELKDIIISNSDFVVEKDLSKGTKREDVVAYQVSISIDTLKKYIEEDYGLDEVEDEELFDELMSMADEAAMELEEVMPPESILNARAYKWDNSDNAIKVIISICNEELGELKLSDVTKRLLTQVD